MIRAGLLRTVVFFGFFFIFVGCQNPAPPETHVDNTATRYTAGLITATEKAKSSVDQANQAIAKEQSAADKMAQEAQ